MSGSQNREDDPVGEVHLPSDVTEAPSPQRVGKPLIKRWLEIAEAVVMGVVAVATAWGGYQAARWSGLQSAQYSEASEIRVEAARASTIAGQHRLYDVVVFNQWIDAQTSGDTELADMYRRRFRPEFEPAFQAWLATDPFRNAQAPPGPTFMPEYRVTEAEQASQLEAEAANAFKVGQAADQQSDAYVLNAVFLASTLFFVAIGQRFDWVPVRLAILAGAIVMLAYGLYHLMIYPVY